MSAMIEVAGLLKRFGPFTAVAGLDFTVAKGEVLGFLGPNGAGKSTTMRMITGSLAPTAGRVAICGNDVAEQPRPAQRLFGYLPEGAPAYGDMTPRGFLAYVAAVRGLDRAGARVAIARAVERTDLGPVLDQSIDTLSKGFKRRVGLAQAILHDPPVLIMDEPTDGLDPNQKFAVRALLTEMAAEKAIIISTHILEEVDALCTRAVIIDRGRIVADGTPAALSTRSRYHNAVTVRVAAALADTVRREIETLPGVATVDAKQVSQDEVSLTAFTAGEALIIEPVSALATAKGWPLKGLYAEPGRLDEVFRRLTHSDAEIGEKAVA